MSLRTIGSALLLLAGLFGACVSEEEGIATTRSAVTDNPPHAAFSVVCIDLTCSADAEASSDDVFIANYAWSWGDGSVTSGGSSASAPSHTYAAFNVYTITLTVTDSIGQTGSTSQTVILIPGPHAEFTASCSGRTCSFDASASSSGVPLTNFHWDWDDETTTDTTSTSATHVYAYGATFRVHLTVTDAKGESNGVTHNVVVP
jgi:PKD repeat protein